MSEALPARYNLSTQINDSPLSIKPALKSIREKIDERFTAGEDIETLIHDYTDSVDQALCHIWTLFQAEDSKITLVAVGGYGRGELHPSSDIDLLILLPDNPPEGYEESLGQFLTCLWDVGLEIGHSVRTVDECVTEAKLDQTVITNMIETRFITGSKTNFEAMIAATSVDKIWPGDLFYKAKLEERSDRYKKFGSAAYRLEPNVKEGPGGLRDIHMVSWVLKRHFGTQNLAELVNSGFLNKEECRMLINGRNFLWRVRFALHKLSKRREDRLLFDYQRTIADMFGYQEKEHRLAVEQFMKDYYQKIVDLNRLIEMLLGLFEEAILHHGKAEEIVPVNTRFQLTNGYLEVTSQDVFHNNRFAIMEVFLLMQQNRHYKGVRASTIRLIRSNLHLINDSFRRDIRSRSIFLEMFKQRRGLTHELRRMNRYGVLAAYLPPFGAIVGLMQYDLYHIFTVDEHTLYLIRNLRRLNFDKHANEYPLASKISRQLPKHELLYLAGLYHDIAKGRGGDHARLGAIEARLLCENIGLGDFDTNLVSWLVESHLQMSSTAQREDISDPDVITKFANFVGDQLHLDYLYLLTMCDIRATDPQLYNGWKDSLLKELYYSTRRALRRGLENPQRRIDRLIEIRKEVNERLGNSALHRKSVENFLETLDDDYILRHSVDEIYRHTHMVLNSNEDEHIVVSLESESSKNGTEIFIYMPDGTPVFSILTHLLEQQNLNIVDARIITSKNGMSFNTYIVLDQEGKPMTDKLRLKTLETQILQALKNKLPQEQPLPVHKKRRNKHFKIEPAIRFLESPQPTQTVLEVSCNDKIGILSRIATALNELNINLLNAKISTYGERVEDIFVIVDSNQSALDTTTQIKLKDSINNKLTQENQGC